MLTIFMVLSLSFVYSNQAAATGKFTVETKISHDAEKLKIIAFANGDSEFKMVGEKTNTISFQFDQKNELASVDGNDEYFVCAYDLDSKTDKMKSYSCFEGILKIPMEKT